jgi:hypothetical protein
MIPAYLESLISEDQLAHCDLMLYNISPSIAVPHTYPMLDPTADVCDLQTLGEYRYTEK